jgi:hypothetical protein
MVELAPAVRPGVVHFADDRTSERRSDSFGGAAVRGQLDSFRVLLLLESFGRELDEARPQLLGALGRDGDCGADQWNAFFSFSKKPAWCW